MFPHPFNIEHVAVPNAVGKVTKTEWDGQNLWYEAEIYDDETAEKIRKGLVQHVSVGADYETLDVLDGKVPHGLQKSRSHDAPLRTNWLLEVEKKGVCGGYHHKSASPA